MGETKFQVGLLVFVATTFDDGLEVEIGMAGTAFFRSWATFANVFGRNLDRAPAILSPMEVLLVALSGLVST